MGDVTHEERAVFGAEDASSSAGGGSTCGEPFERSESRPAQGPSAGKAAGEATDDTRADASTAAGVSRGAPRRAFLTPPRAVGPYHTLREFVADNLEKQPNVTAAELLAVARLVHGVELAPQSVKSYLHKMRRRKQAKASMRLDGPSSTAAPSPRERIAATPPDETSLNLWAARGVVALEHIAGAVDFLISIEARLHELADMLRPVCKKLGEMGDGNADLVVAAYNAGASE